MLDDPREDFGLEPGGFEPFERFAADFEEAEEEGAAEAFDPFMFNL